MIFQEDLLHFIWRFKRFRFLGIKTASGEPLEIIFPGTHNHHAGPDFLGAKISIGGTLWAGNVEIHIRSSDWKKHRHHTDPAYDNVILHVVYTHDCDITRTDGTLIPVLVLQDKTDEAVFVKYHQLMYSGRRFIPCEDLVRFADSFYIDNWLERMLFQRLQNRAEEITVAVAANQGDWDETFYQFLAKNFGFKTNALPFELLARSLPQRILAKHKRNSLQTEALIFGQAGLLDEEFTDAYPLALKKEYVFLRIKYSLTPVDGHLWKFFRLRPHNFPTIRLAQFAALTGHSSHLFSGILSVKTASAYEQCFPVSGIHEYWNTHYRFGKTSAASVKNIGTDAVNNLLINTVSPFLFAYGRYVSDSRITKRAISLLENIAPEKNNIVNGFVDLGFSPGSAQHSQSLIELKNNYCDKKRCLACGIGCTLLKPV